MTTPPKRAAIYTRVSRDDTGEGRSNDRQEQDCRAWARLRGYEVVHVEEDISISAYSGRKRPGWERIKDLMREQAVDVVIAWKMDRITRTVRELTGIISLSRETGVPIATTDGDFDLSTEAGKAVATILGAVAEMEVERKGTRQKAANAQRRAEGHRWASGWRPFGYELDGTLIPSEADAIREAAADVLTGTPLREIARRWREAGLSTPRSAKGSEGWTHNGVRSILLNPRNAGFNTYKGEIVGKGSWDPILSEDVHVRLVARLTDPSRTTRRGRKPTNLLSGIAICDVCEEAVEGGTVGRTRQIDGKRTNTGERIAVYKCRNNHLSANRAEIDQLVVSGFAAAVALSVNTAQLMPLDKRGSEVADLATEAQRLTDEMAAVANSYAEGRLTLAQMEIATGSLQARLEAVEGEIARVEDGGLDTRRLIGENVKQWLSLDTATRRQILSRIARVRLYPKGKGRKKVPALHQVTMHLVIYRPDGSERLIPAINDRPTKGAP